MAVLCLGKPKLHFSGCSHILRSLSKRHSQGRGKGKKQGENRGGGSGEEECDKKKGKRNGGCKEMGGEKVGGKLKKWGEMGVKMGWEKTGGNKGESGKTPEELNNVQAWGRVTGYSPKIRNRAGCLGN